MLKILKARLQQHVNCELPDVQAGIRKGRGTRDQDQDNHDDVIAHLEPDILEWEVKWALGSTTNGIPVELSQILKDDAVNVLYSICQQIWNTQQWPQDWKRSVFFQSQRKAMPKNAQTTTQLHSSHMLVK